MVCAFVWTVVDSNWTKGKKNNKIGVRLKSRNPWQISGLDLIKRIDGESVREETKDHGCWSSDSISQNPKAQAWSISATGSLIPSLAFWYLYRNISRAWSCSNLIHFCNLRFTSSSFDSPIGHRGYKLLNFFYTDPKSKILGFLACWKIGFSSIVVKWVAENCLENRIRLLRIGTRLQFLFLLS